MSSLDELVEHLNVVALGTTVELAHELLHLAVRAREYFAGGTDPPVVALGRFLSDDERLDSIRPALHAAAVHGSLTWTPEPSAEVAHAIAFTLRALSSQEVAIAIIRRLNGLKPVSPIFSPASPAAGYLIETSALHIASATVRARLLDLFRNIRFSKFYAVIFLQIVRLDAKSIPLFVDRMLEFAPTFPTMGGRPAYMLGFDAQLNIVDVENIVGSLSETQSKLFARRFLSHSQIFVQSTEGLIEVRSPASDSQILSGTSEQPASEALPAIGRSRSKDWEAEMFLGLLLEHLANPSVINDDLASVGVAIRPMFVAPPNTEAEYA